MVNQKRKIIEFAQSLYLEVNDEGNKIHTWDSISKSIQKRFKQEIHYSTIAKWSKKYDWENLFSKIKMAGIERGKEQLQEKENKIIDERAQTIADIYKSNKQLQSLSQKTILARLTGQKLKDVNGNDLDSDFGNTDLIRILQHSEQTLLTLHDKNSDKEKNKEKGVKIKIGDAEFEV
jgi:hypothetical protein